MKTLQNVLCAASLIVGLIGPAAAQAPALDVKVGLWEVASDRSASGAPQVPAMPHIPPQVLAQMTPAQRAQIESAMKNARSHGNSRLNRKGVKKICVTRESLRRGLTFGAETRPSCKQTVRTRSSTAWEVRQTCTEGGGRQTIHVRYEAPTPDTMNGTVDISMNNGGRKMAMKQVMRGRWLGPDCGNVKPK